MRIDLWECKKCGQMTFSNGKPDPHDCKKGGDCEDVIAAKG